MTIVETLRTLSAYPIPRATLVAIAEARNLRADDEATSSDALTLAKGDVYMWLAVAPDVSQGGQSFSFSDEQRKHFRQMAQSYYAEAGVARKSTIYGWKGSQL